jgi:chromosome segregation ATPase
MTTIDEVIESLKTANEAIKQLHALKVSAENGAEQWKATAKSYESDLEARDKTIEQLNAQLNILKKFTEKAEIEEDLWRMVEAHNEAIDAARRAILEAQGKVLSPERYAGMQISMDELEKLKL